MRRRVTPAPCVAWLLPTLSAVALLACNQNKLDQDGDGFTELTGDCDDLDANVHPEAQEVCYNGIDDNCNGIEDEEGATSGRLWYIDLDGDGYGNETITLEACTQPDGFAAERWDCDEDRAEVHPGAVEVCDALDNDCDGQIDETTSADAMTWYADGDGDGYGDDDRAFVSCEPPGEGWIATGGDCADGDPLVSPEQTESCLTPYDDNCDGVVSSEDAFGCTVWYADLDGDGHAGTAACLCAPEAPWTATEATDCDDSRAEIYPGSPTEDLGWSDGNCDGRVDRALAAADARFDLGYVAEDPRFANRAISWSGGDMDGDGHDDLAVAMAYYAGGPGAVLVASGSELASEQVLMETATAALSTSEDAPTGRTKIVRISGFQPHLVDLNEDGLADLVVASEVTDGTENTYEVSAYLSPFSGSLDGVLPDGTLTVPKAFDHHKSRNLRRAGDDSTGRPLLSLADRYASDPFLGLYVGEVTRFGWDNDEGELSVHSITRGANARQYLGVDVGDVGDINGDGVADHGVSTLSQVTSDPYGRHISGYGGSIDLYNDESGEPATIIVSNSGYRNIAEHFGGPGDLDGDGHADLVFSAWASDLGAHEAGRVQVVWGPVPTGVHELSALDLLVIHGDADYAHVECPAVIADADGDGRDDLAIGSDGEVAPGLSGRTYLWTGERVEGHLVAGDGMVVIEDARVDSIQYHGYCDHKWLAVHSPGDVDNDGLGDLLIRGGVSEADDPDQTDSLFLFRGVAR